MQRLSIYAARVTRHPSNVQTKNGPRVSLMLVVYGEVNPENQAEILIYEKPVLVSELIGANSELLKQGTTKGTTLYIPATAIAKDPIIKGDGTTLQAQDGTPIHRFIGMSVKDIVLKDQPAAMEPTIKQVSKSKILTAETAEAPGLLAKMKALFAKHA